jgi:tRNA 2-thiocytidine biosynthesis protein TtcA
VIEPSKPPRSLLSAAGRAIGDFSMIREGDRVLLGLSGGKDSLALLHVLIALKKKAPIHFDLGVCTVDPQSSAFDPAPLKPYSRAGDTLFLREPTDFGRSQKSPEGGGFLLCLLFQDAARHSVSRGARKWL